MRHLDEETLALLSLGEDVASAEELRHLAGCPRCTTALADLRRTVALGRSALDVGELPAPAPRVWAGIERELGLGGGLRRIRRRRIVVALVVAAAVVAAVVVGVRLLLPRPPHVIASTTLVGLPAWPGASGTAVVESGPDGIVLDLHLDARARPAHFREVWLMTADQRRLVSLGVLHGSSGEFAVPKGVDVARFDLVDVSSEPHDGNPHHSGDSIARGALTARS